jgi:hypothetical protein
MENFFLLMLIPVIWALVARLVLKATISWKEMGLQILASVVVVGVVYGAGTYNQTADFEVWNGKITKKVREHGSYVRTYQCNCYTTCTGSGTSQSCTQHCSTCFEDHYTVDWFVKSTIGDIGIKSLDRTSRSVYDTPDPAAYTAAYVGEGCAATHSYKNYIKAVPDSLFNDADVAADAEFAPLIPSYPKVHSFYKINRVLAMGVPVKSVDKWDLHLRDRLRAIGPAKQANIILILVNTPDQSYRYSLERAWLGGKKNDVIVLMGVSEYPNIDWVDTITLGSNSGNELMTVKMRDDLMALKTIDNYVAVIDTVADTVTNHFDRKSMEDFKYLEDEIEPPVWVIGLATGLSILISIGLTLYFHLQNPFGDQRYRPRYHRRSGNMQSIANRIRRFRRK